MSAATIAAVATVATAGIGAASAAGAFGPGTPAAPNYGQMTADSLQAQIDLLPKQLEARKQYDSQFADLDRATHTRNIEEGLGLAEQYGSRINALATANREAAIADVSRLGPSALASLRQYDPASTGLLDAYTAQAADEALHPGQLTEAQRRQIQQNVRQGQAARGMGFGNADLYAEALNLYGGQNERLQQQRQFGMNIINQRAQQYGDPYRILGLGDARNTNPGGFMTNSNGNSLAGGEQFQAGGLQAGLMGYQAQNQARIAGYNSQMQGLGALAGNFGALGQAGQSLYGSFGGGHSGAYNINPGGYNYVD